MKKALEEHKYESIKAHILDPGNSPLGEEVMDRSYGGVPLNAAPWAVSMALDLVRRRLS
jgi:hypothetical protein